MKKSFLAGLLLLLASPLMGQTTRINAGGGSYVDSNGNTWAADSGYNEGRSYSRLTPIAGTTDPILYNYLRYSASSAPMIYTFTLNNGSYNVNLGFAELVFTNPGQRVFNVKINGTQVLTNYDVFATAGLNRASIEGFPVTVTNGTLVIEFDSVANYAMVSTIEILFQTPPPPPPQHSVDLVGVDNINPAGSVTYSILRATAPCGTNISAYTILVSGLTTPTYSDTTIVQGTTYCYVAQAVSTTTSNTSGFPFVATVNVK